METSIFNIPTFALPYLVNGDSDNLTQDEISTLNTWQQENRVVSVNPTDTEPYFCHSNDVLNAFLACDVQECICAIDND